MAKNLKICYIIAMKRHLSILLSILIPIYCALTLTACDGKNLTYQKQLTAFDTVISITVYDKTDAKCLDEIADLCLFYDRLFSRTTAGSDIYNVNHAKGKETPVHPETVRLIEDALVYCEASDGLFDITIAPVKDLWDFTNPTNAGTPPAEEELREALKHVDYRLVQVDPKANTVTLTDPDAAIDLGAIAKGYIADRIKEKLLAAGVQHALIDLGGNILCVGGKKDHTAFTIGIKDPEEPAALITSVSVYDSGIVTSGTYERFFEYNGVTYHHILDPETGYPVKTDLTSASILSSSSEEGDALSTICILLGSEKASDLIRKRTDIQAIFVREDHSVLRIN